MIVGYNRSMSTPRISPRKVLVTGGTGEIGGAVSAAFAARGDRVAITSRDGRLDERSHATLAVPLELADADSVAPAVARAIEGLDGLDTLVANAVRWPEAKARRFEELPAREWRAVLRANVEGTFEVVQAALPALRSSGRGRIVLISSGVAEEGHPPTPDYAAAKAALHGLGRVLAWDAGADRVLVNVVAVGFTRTEKGIARLSTDIYDRAGELTPQRRASTPLDVAQAILWLGSDQNTSITGEAIREGTSAARTPLVALG
jgi:3-oxoacyl-[acyl-carrier protein] reductase